MISSLHQEIYTKGKEYTIEYEQSNQANKEIAPKEINHTDRA